MVTGRTSGEDRGSPQAETASSHRRAVERVAGAMREGKDGPLSLRDMADIAHLSPFHFARVFKAVTGVPPGEFSAALRLGEAKRLLLTTDLSVGEICFEVGYESLGTFTSRFARLVGATPGEVRRLPEELGRALENARGPSLPRTPLRRGAGVAFRVAGPCPEGALIFAGLFPGAVPQGRPVAGAVVAAPGTYRMAPVPDGPYHLMAAALPFPEDPLEMLLPGDALRVGRGQDPVTVRGGRSGGVADVALRPPRTTDPPVVVALPALFLEWLGSGKYARQTAR